MKKFQHLTVNLNPHVANMVLVTNQENTVVAQFQVSFEIIFAKKKKKKKNQKFSVKIGTTLRFVNMDTNEVLADDTVIVYEDLSSGEKEAGLTNSEGELIIKVIK